MVDKGEIVKCPICNKTLFVKSPEVVGEIEIKCLRCKNIIKLELKNQELKSQ